MTDQATPVPDPAHTPMVPASNEPVTAMPLAVPPPGSDVPDFSVFASEPQQMEEAQQKLIAWARNRLAESVAEADDLAENVEIAKRQKWGNSALKRAHDRALKGVAFHEKLLAALEAGYCLIPNFPVDVFAIKTTKKNPVRGDTSNPPWRDSHLQESNSPPAGEGEYVSDVPVVRTVNEGTDDRGNTSYSYYASSFRDVDFPFTLAKPQILEATARAQAQKIFDSLGSVGEPKQRPGPQPRKGDPIIVGRIYDSRDPTRQKFLSFLVAWWIDTRDLR